MSARQRRRSPAANRKRIAAVATVGLVAVLALVQPVLAQLGYSVDDLIAMVWQPSITRATTPSVGSAEVHFIDVGQAGAILIKGSEKNALIDAGEAQNADDIADYLAANGVERIDYFFNTHPHADHMGGCVGVMEAVPTGQFLMTPLPDKLVPTTTGYKKLLEYLSAHKEATPARAAALGDVFELGGGLSLEVIGPVRDYKELNNQSLVLQMNFGATAFLFPGDAEAEAEQDILADGKLQRLAVLAAPHHGSSTSLNPDFFAAIAPSKLEISAGLPPLLSVISCGKGNDYGHPSPQTLELYRALGITWHRTDQNGSIKIVTDGRRLTVTAQRP